MKLPAFYKLLLPALLLALLLALAGAAPGQTANAQDGKVRVWVVFQPGAKGQVQSALNASQAEFHYTFDDLNAFVVSLPPAAAEGISKNPNVVLVEEDAVRAPIGIVKSAAQAAAQTTLSGQVVPYGIDLVQARDVWDFNRDGVVDSNAPTGANRKVCVIDSGLYTAHEDFAGLNAAGYDGNLPWSQDGSGHGTHVTGTITAMNNALGVVGVTPGAVQVFVVRVFGDSGSWAYSSTLVDAANRCQSAGANIISMSLGGTFKSISEETAFNNLYAAGILSIAAAGNAGNNRVSYPAGYGSVVAVAAVDSNKQWATFSQFNSTVELAAPGVGVLSTVPWKAEAHVTVDGVTYTGGQIEFAANGAATGSLANGGLCKTTGDWKGMVVLCQRGDISFYDKVRNVQNSGGAAAVIYNNVSGGFAGTLGAGNTSTIPAISLSQEDGLFLVANKLGRAANVVSTLTKPASDYESWDGTSMATPHVSGVAALVWSANPTWTNAQIREALQKSAQDLGSAGRDNYFGFGLVQARAALDYANNTFGGGGGGGPTPALSVSVTTDKATYAFRETAVIAVAVTDGTNLVSGAAVKVVITSAKGKKYSSTGTTGSNGIANFNFKVNTKDGTGMYLVEATASKNGYTSGAGTTSFNVQ